MNDKSKKVHLRVLELTKEKMALEITLLETELQLLQKERELEQKCKELSLSLQLVRARLMTRNDFLGIK